MRKYALQMGTLGICIISLIISLFVYNEIANSEIINHELRLAKDDAGDYMIISMPHELYSSEGFNILDRMGVTSVIFMCRRDGKWDPEPLIGSRRPRNHPLIEGAIGRLRLFMDVCDEVIPNEEIISIGYYADYNELVIYLSPDLLKDRIHYEKVIRKLNNALVEDLTEEDKEI